MNILFREHTNISKISLYVLTYKGDVDDTRERPILQLLKMMDEHLAFNITVNILNKKKAVLEKVKPDVVLVHGDTSTTFATALTCFYIKIPVGHVEAGLRTNNIYFPYPGNLIGRRSAL